MSKPLMEVRDLEVRFKTLDGVVKAVNGISYDVNEKETIAIVGESGSGKSVSVMSLLRLIACPPGEISGGSAVYKGEDLLKMNMDQLRKIRGKEIGIVFQDPMTSLNPVLRIDRQMTEMLELHLGLTPAQAKTRAIEMLKMVGIPGAEQRINNYPHQFSGGMRQRVMIAMALACQPSILIADEPTTALDVTVQAQIVKLVKQLKHEFNMAIIWISHDLGVVAGLAEKIIVMYAGRIVEMSDVVDLYHNPKHPYTIGLLESLPRVDQKRTERLQSIEGMPPDLTRLGDGCPFAPRCKWVKDRCYKENPVLHKVNETHQTACWENVTR